MRTEDGWGQGLLHSGPRVTSHHSDQHQEGFTQHLQAARGGLRSWWEEHSIQSGGSWQCCYQAGQVTFLLEALSFAKPSSGFHLLDEN